MTGDADDRRRPSFRNFNAVQVHVSLDDIEPRIWRRLIVPLDTTLADMHHTGRHGLEGCPPA
jgi:hypothetical protein